jgi:hypothetical protein
VVVVETVLRRYTSAALALVAEFLIHPIAAVFAAIFVGTTVLMRLVRRERIRLTEIAIPAVVTVIGCGIWIFWIASRSTIGGGAVDAATFIALNRAQNMHWFPSYRGLYWESHWEELLPVLSTLALIAWSYGAQRVLPQRTADDLACGIGVLMLVCCVGLLVAEFLPIPVLVKLALHRADTSALILGGLLVLPALYRDIVEGDPIERALASILLLLPFVSSGGLVPLPVAARVAYAAIRARRSGVASAALTVAIALVALTWILMAVYAVGGQLGRIWEVRYSGMRPPVLAVAVIAAIGPLVLRMTSRGALGLAALLVVAAAGLICSPGQNALASAAARHMAVSMFEAQTWARKNTPEGTIFMVSPELSYSWRDKSHRPSFGTPREWLLISVMYDSRRALLDEGFRRYQSLGLAYPAYLHDPSQRRADPMLQRLYGDATRRFYGMSRAELESLARSYNIGYFVYVKSKLKGDAPLPIVFQNDEFVITAAR